jgi:hypothetical protein
MHRIREGRSPAAIAALAALLAASSGCASAAVIHTSVSDPAIDAADRGIRYVGTSPYLIAHSDGKGGVVTRVAYLPDPAKKMSAKPVGRLADVDVTMDFDRGVLTTSAESGDATAVQRAIAQAVKAFVPQLLSALALAETSMQYEVPAPYIYKIDVRGSDVFFLGGQGDAPIRITLVPQEPDGASQPQENQS